DCGQVYIFLGHSFAYVQNCGQGIRHWPATCLTSLMFQIFTCRLFLRLHFHQVEFFAVTEFRFETSAKRNQNSKLSDCLQLC
ncbi:MAG: hypothetical protein CMM80_01260, partial [Rhodospirillaceae bacterium]|nr:hypothetical protein [Rhodospirillaceae bacterium]